MQAPVISRNELQLLFIFCTLLKVTLSVSKSRFVWNKSCAILELINKKTSILLHIHQLSQQALSLVIHILTINMKSDN